MHEVLSPTTASAVCISGFESGCGDFLAAPSEPADLFLARATVGGSNWHSITIQNGSWANQDAGPFTVWVYQYNYWSGSFSAITSITFPNGLRAGTSEVVSFYADLHGHFTVEIDVHNQVTESNEFNNVAGAATVC